MADNELMCECLSQHVAAHDLDVVPSWLSENPAPHTCTKCRDIVHQIRTITSGYENATKRIFTLSQNGDVNGE